MTTTEVSRPDDYPHLTSPFRAMKAQYDVIVVGSGYGAGVAASRMARAGKSVAVLGLGWERRRAYTLISNPSERSDQHSWCSGLVPAFPLSMFKGSQHLGHFPVAVARQTHSPISAYFGEWAACSCRSWYVDLTTSRKRLKWLPYLKLHMTSI